MLRHNTVSNDFTHCHRQGLLIRLSVNQRANVRSSIVLQVSVVRVNLACTAGTENHQAVLGLRLLNQRVSAGAHDALGSDTVNEVVVLVFLDFVCH